MQSSTFMILGSKVNPVQAPEVINLMEYWIQSKIPGNYIVISNAHDIIAAKEHVRIKESINKSNLSVPDGISLVLASRAYGYRLKKRVYGPDLMFEFLRISQDRRYAHFFYGSTIDILNKLTYNLKKTFPGLNIAGVYAPPFRRVSEDEDKVIIDIINKSNADVIWVGLGCPKQQLWMYEHKEAVTVPVMVGVGAAFDFLAGTKPQAPQWIRNNGFEWFFRLISEPKRLWRRYLVIIPLFVFYASVEFILISLKKIVYRRRFRK